MTPLTTAPRQISLGELINRLKNEPNQQKRVKVGFNNPHSYRGFYEQLAFEVAHGKTVQDMLEEATSALGATYQGYKGGYFKMREYTEVWLVAQEGSQGETLGAVLLEFMLSTEL